METVLAPVAGESAEAARGDDEVCLKPEEQLPSPANENWFGDEETLRCHAVSLCTDAWGLVYTALIDGVSRQQSSGKAA